MSEGHRQDTWSRAASLMALLANCHRDAKRRREPYLPTDFLPADVQPRPKQESTEAKIPLSALRDIFVPKKG